MRIRLRNGESGSSLVSVLVGVGITGVLAAAAATVATQMQSSTRKAELRSELAMIREMVWQNIDCNATLGPAPACPSTSAPGGQTAPFFRIRRLTNAPGPVYLTTALNAAGEGKVGDWTLRVSCSGAEKSLVVRAARPLPGGGFAKDPVTGVSLDWTLDKGLLFGGAGLAMPLCFNSQKESIVCRSTSEDPNTSGSASGWRHLRFTAAQCGGTLPDKTYVGSLAKSEVCGSEQSVMALQPTEVYATLPSFISTPAALATPLPMRGPGFAYFWSAGGCSPASASNIEVVYTKLSH